MGVNARVGADEEDVHGAVSVVAVLEALVTVAQRQVVDGAEFTTEASHEGIAGAGDEHDEHGDDGQDHFEGGGTGLGEAASPSRRGFNIAHGGAWHVRAHGGSLSIEKVDKVNCEAV